MLLPSDVGRPIFHLATSVHNVDVVEDARAVLANEAPPEREAESRDGMQFLMRVLPYRTTTGETCGVVITLTDVSRLKDTERELRAAEQRLRDMNQTLEQAIADRTKWLKLVHEVTLAINLATNRDEALRTVLARLAQAEQWQVGYVYLPDRETPEGIVPVVDHVASDRFGAFNLVSRHRRYARGQSLPGRVYAEGAPVWVCSQAELMKLLPVRGDAARAAGLISAVALPITFEHNVIAVLELFSDRIHEPNDMLSTLMNDVSDHIGKIVERDRLTSQAADLVWREQQALLHTLHDSLGQTLAGLGMLSSGLSQRLKGTDPGAIETAGHIAQQAQHALEQVRQLSRGLFPVEITVDGLVAALEQLAATTQAMHNIRVRITRDASLHAPNDRVATEMFRIAQEAVTNAVKHAHPRTIVVALSDGSLRITDDGIGIQDPLPKHNGMGLRIMRHRANVIGGQLSVIRGGAGGTSVTLLLNEHLMSQAIV